MTRSSSCAWSISIKTVGNRSLVRRPSSSSSGQSEEGVSREGESVLLGEATTFIVQVDPDEPLSSLHRKIQTVTGLEPSRQRLIYRGRIIAAELQEEQPMEPPDSHVSDHQDYANTSITHTSLGELAVDTTNHDQQHCLLDATRATAERMDDRLEFGSDSPSNNSIHSQTPLLQVTDTGSGEEIPQQRNEMSKETPLSSQTLKKVPLTQRIRDVKGLSDGHTIHLVPRPPTTTITTAASSEASLANSFSSFNPFRLGESGGLPLSTEEDGSDTASLSASMNLLAILLGLSSRDRDSTSNNGVASAVIGPIQGDANTQRTSLFGVTETPNFSMGDMSLLTTGDGTRNPRRRIVTRERRIELNRATTLARLRAASVASPARLTEADLRIPDPGSMEPVRQGLITLHTLLGNALVNSQVEKQTLEETKSSPLFDGDNREEIKDEEEEKVGDVGEDSAMLIQRPMTTISTNPLLSHRKWYRGQWLDALDTVNQWLEATIVDIVLPSDILPSFSSPSPCVKKNHFPRALDAVVSANDLEGRRRLLLEPCYPTETDEDSLDNEGLSTMDKGYRQRDDNDGVQLLLIHYNGWPHRWDEWIRSDSVRIRPFRTRTKHTPTSRLVSPTPQAVFRAAPATHITDDDDDVERASLLPELHRVLSSVNEVLSLSIPNQVRPDPEDLSPFSPSPETTHLPWLLSFHDMETNLSLSERTSLARRSDICSQLDIAQLRQLAPLIDRLGRTLTDAAPHIAALADSLSLAGVSVGTNVRPPVTTRPPQSLGRHSPPLERIRDLEEESEIPLDTQSPHGDDIQNTISPVEAVQMEYEVSHDPDLSDYINGMVNTTRGGNRNDRDSNQDPIGSGSSLSSYLASQNNRETPQPASNPGLLTIGEQNAANGDQNVNADNALSRLVRMGLIQSAGGAVSGPGIDIHIHAVVTGPGINTFGTLGGLGGVETGGVITALPSLLRTTNESLATLSNSNRIPMESVQHVENLADSEDDLALFSELYSESPASINMHGSNEAEVGGVVDDAIDSSQMSEECSINEGDGDLIVTDSELQILASTSFGEEASSTCCLLTDPKMSKSLTDKDVKCAASNSEHPLSGDDSSSPNIEENNSYVTTIDSSGPTKVSFDDSAGSVHTVSEIGSSDTTQSSNPSSASQRGLPRFLNRLFHRAAGRVSGTNRQS